MAEVIGKGDKEMTKQNEIREGVADLIFEITHCRNGEAEYCGNRIFGYLYSQDMVLRVDGELPDTAIFKGDNMVRHTIDTAQKNMLKAGYVLVEPLEVTANVK